MYALLFLKQSKNLKYIFYTELRMSVAESFQ